MDDKFEDFTRLWKQENVPFRNITQVLGVKWDTDKDVFQIDVQAKIVEASKEPVTKRLLLKLMSKFYNPLVHSLQLLSL
ncbi:hypothetical protein TNCT_68421 [Trichonephila clavata]|uniref:Uncharacterized protein n=1 Tax=Trichonephila clavata TaxID=2740835 RepID=A0A8X6LAV3_TRICU|nr:hypothetical protein TNCT_68421 [Trichonephila clavata]